MGGNDAGHQANAGAGIAHINHAIGFTQRTDANTCDMPGAVFIAGDSGAKFTHGVRRCQNVFAFQKAGNLGCTDCQTTKHQGAMRNRLVTRNPDIARKRPGLGRGKRTFGLRRTHGLVPASHCFIINKRLIEIALRCGHVFRRARAFQSGDQCSSTSGWQAPVSNPKFGVGNCTNVRQICPIALPKGKTRNFLLTRCSQDGNWASRTRRCA